MKTLPRMIVVVLAVWLGTAPSLLAERLRGRIRNISFKSKTIEILDFSIDKHRIFRFSTETVTINARSIKDFHKHDNVEIRFSGGIDLQSIKKMLVYVPKEKVIHTSDLQKLINDPGSRYFLIDTRTWREYQEGHLPTAVWAPGERFSQYEHLLPAEKNSLLIFYSHGVTSDQAVKTARLAELEGYHKVKVYAFGYFAWKRYRQPITVHPAWLIKNLDPHTVLIDTRNRSESIDSHIKTAVAIPAEKILKLGRQTRLKRSLPGLPDRNAPVILYGNDTHEAGLLAAFQELLNWKYENVAILDGGFKTWAIRYPVERTPAPTHIKYERYVAEGSVSADEFKSLVNSKTALILDIRTDHEAENGTIQGALHIPLSELDKRLHELSHSQPIIIHCVNGIRAQIGYSLLKGEGFKRVKFLNSVIIIERSGDFSIIGM